MAGYPTHETVVALPSAARTTAQDLDFQNEGHRGVHVIIDVTSVTDTPSITPTIQGKDPASGKFYDILVGSAITTTGTTALTVYPGVTETANVKESDTLPQHWRLALAVADADSATYSVGLNLLP